MEEWGGRAYGDETGLVRYDVRHDKARGRWHAGHFRFTSLGALIQWIARHGFRRIA